MEEVYVFDMGKVIKQSFDKKKFYSLIDAKIGFDDFNEYFEIYNFITEIGEITSDQFLEKVLKYSLSTKTINETKSLYDAASGDLYPDTVKIINSIKANNKKVYLFSNMKGIDFECFSKKIDINIFDDLFLSYKLGYRKSSLNIFKMMIDKIQVTPENIYFFDDLTINIENAKSLGINAFQVTGDTIMETWNKIKKF